MNLQNNSQDIILIQVQKSDLDHIFQNNFNCFMNNLVVIKMKNLFKQKLEIYILVSFLINR